MAHMFTLHLMEGSSIDGGPFEAATVEKVDPDAEQALIRHTPTETELYDTSVIADMLTEELADGQPVRVGGAPLNGGVGPWATVAVTLPLVDGMMLDIPTYGMVEPSDIEGVNHHLEAQKQADRNGATLSPA
jgi:hypothetical protein